MISSSLAPSWGISLAYWLHMLATVVWIGGLSSLALLVLPAANRALEEAAYAVFLGELQRRLDALSWFCLAILVGTGLIQMSVNPNYQGFLAISNHWASAILIKHLTIGVMVIVSAIITWGVLPGLRRAILRMGRKASEAGLAGADHLNQVKRASQASLRLIRINLILAVIVLALTAIARAGN